MCECKCVKQKSLADVKREEKERFKTIGQTVKDFKVRDKVKIIVPCQDFHFFNGETGRVIAVNGTYLAIKVKFDEPRHYKDWTMYEFNFEPEDLITFKNYKKLFKEW